MKVVPFFHTRKRTFISDLTGLAICANQHVAALNGGITLTSFARYGALLLLLCRNHLQHRLNRMSSPAEATLRMQKISSAERIPLILSVILAAMFFAMLGGCGYSGSANGVGVALQGTVYGGLQPVAGSTIQLYATGTSGVGSTAQPLLLNAIKTDTNGNFSVPADYRCPSPSSQVYVVASGGNPARATSENNPALKLTAMLGSCSNLSSASSITVNEVTTVGSIWPLAHYMTSSTRVGSAANDTTFLAAVSSVSQYVNVAKGTSPGVSTPSSHFAENAKLYSLADLLAECAGSSGGVAGDGTPCGRLFSIANPQGGSAPTDTMTAAIRIAQNPENAVSEIFDLATEQTPFQPALTAMPTDWTLNLTFAVATPTLSLGTGTYVGPQELTISDSTKESTIYYTTDGTVPTTSSPTYAGAISIGTSSTVQAMAAFHGSTSAVASSALTITAEDITPTQLVFVQQPSNTPAMATISPAVQVAVEDASGHPALTAAGPITLALVGGAGLTGTLTATPLNGIATFSDLSVSTPDTGLTLSATGSQLSFANSAPFNIGPPTSGAGLPAKLAFMVQPSNAATGATISPAVQVVVEDSNGNVLQGAKNPVTLALAGGNGLGGTLTVTPKKGIATFSDLAISSAGTGYTLTATSPSLVPATSASFNISTPGSNATQPSKLAFVQQPSNALAGATISPAVQVAVEDVNGNVVSAATNPITLALAGGSGLGGTLTVTPQNGIATFSDLSVSTAGSGYTLSAGSPNLSSATSASFIISASGSGPSPAQLVFLQQPSNAVTGATVSPAVQVVIQDANGNTVTAATNPVTLALVGGNGLGGTLTVTPRNGIATFSDLSVNTAGTGYTLSATSPALTSAVSAAFNINAPSGGGSPVKLAFLQQPSNAVTGATITPAVQVLVQDASGNTVQGSTNPITLTLVGGTGLAGTLTVNAQNGVATFNDLTVSTAGAGYKLSAASPALTSATSAGFTISPSSTNPPPPAKLAFLQQPSNTQVGTAISPAVKVLVEDANGNVVVGATNPVTLVLSSGSGLGGTLTVTPQNGIATFSNLTVSAAGLADTLTANSPDLTSATSTPFIVTGVTVPLPVKLAFLQQPSNATAGATISPAVQVVVQDVNGNTVAGATNPITLAISGGNGLGGTLTVNAQNGVATFSNLSVSTAGSYTLSAASSGLTSATSASFTIAASGGGTPARLVFLVQPSNASTGATISPAVQVAVQDANGNTVNSATNQVTLALTGGSGLGGTLTVTPQNGIATFSNLSVSTAGSYTLSASGAGLSSATSNSFTITTPSTSGKTYYLSPSGSDSNSGLSASLPWLTPNHSLNCGDVVIAASGQYSASNFNTGKWGTVNCPAANNVAWLQCATFDTCKISATSSDGMWVDASYWGVQGWEVTTSNYTYGACFHAGPTKGSTIHHVIFANNVANGCMGGGFNSYNSSTSASVDYIVYIGNIAYNGAQGSGACYSGLNIYQPIASDKNAGTHMYIAGNFSYNNVDGSPCSGGLTTDGEGINLDTFDFSQGGGPAYTQQAVVENNISVSNGSSGVLIENNKTGSSAAPVYFKYNTTYGNLKATNRSFCVGLGEIYAEAANNVTVTNNLEVTDAATGCQGDAIYAASVANSSGDTYQNNWLYSAAGNNMFSSNNSSFAFGTQTVGTNPAFASASVPGAPSCSGAANVPGCMATMIANFTPTATAAKAYGYQPAGANVYDPLFPQWLCNVTLPSGLVTKGCQVGP